MSQAWSTGLIEGQTNSLTLLSSLCEAIDLEDMTEILNQMMPQILA